MDDGYILIFFLPHIFQGQYRYLIHLSRISQHTIFNITWTLIVTKPFSSGFTKGIKILSLVVKKNNAKIKQNFINIQSMYNRLFAAKPGYDDTESRD